MLKLKLQYFDHLMRMKGTQFFTRTFSSCLILSVKETNIRSHGKALHSG